MDLTVVICTLNRRESLLRGLGSLACQSSDAAWEVLVVDNGGSDGSGAAVRELEFPVPLRVVIELERGLSRARNRGLAEAHGRACVFVDDDMTFRPGWVAAFADVFADSDAAGAGGRIHPVLPPGTPDWFHGLMEQEVGGPSGRYDFGEVPSVIVPGGELPTPFGGNMAVRRTVAQALGGFRVDLGWGARRVPCEEVEFFGRLLTAGHRLHYVPAAAVDHHIQAEHVTLEYYLQFQEGSGRASVIMSPPRNIFDRMGKTGTALRNLVRGRWRARGLALDTPGVAARRQVAWTRGRLLELLGH
jgi:glucosyl-dolichyl phosphate glucuronosyltransferase